MDKKIIFITGASGGLGEAMAKHFYALGHQLILHHNENAISLEENDQIKHVKADLTDETEIQAMFEEIKVSFDRIDVVINNAGISKSGISWKTNSDDWSETIALNLTAPFKIVQHTIPLMRKNNWGRIINITSVVAQTGVIGTSAYAASKAGIIGLTKTLSKELIPFNITTNALALGYFDKGMIRDIPTELKEQIIDTIPAKELGKPEVICKTIEFLMQNEAHYVNGQTINLNGGLFS
jgi:NAD(P)-dependent dehydrogenase (short-subunit alcohol dehydrogenase family)